MADPTPNKLDSNHRASEVKSKLRIVIARNLIRATLKASLCLFSLNSLQSLPALAIGSSPSCEVQASDRILKDNLRKNISGSNSLSYRALITKHKDQLTTCRSKDSIKTQALWLRLYPKDAKAEVLEDVLDRIINRGYNAVFVETFYDGRIVLPVSDNPTPWRSLTEEAVKSGQVAASYDLWAEIILKGRERGLKVYGVSSGLNFGYSYSQVSDRTSVLARNGAGETSIAKSQSDPNLNSNLGTNTQIDPNEAERLFIDPYNLQAKSDFSVAIAALVKRQPDGILFDYLRYPSRQGSVNNVRDLWIYGEAARKTLLETMPDLGTKELMATYLATGKVTSEAIALLQENTLKEKTIARSKNPVAAQLTEKILFQIAVHHAYQGILGFVDQAIATINSSDSKIAIGAVFLPNGNPKKASLNATYDSRLQPWDRFPKTMERHPMTYSICNDGKCVANEVVKVIKSSPQSKVCPVLAGTWGKSLQGHPSLEIQIQAIKAVAPQISCISHSSYSWIESSDRDRTGL